MVVGASGILLKNIHKKVKRHNRRNLECWLGMLNAVRRKGARHTRHLLLALPNSHVLTDIDDFLASELEHI